MTRWLPLLWLALALIIISPTLAHAGEFASSYDWKLFQTWLEAGRRTVLWYHQFPLWNPWTCGGQVYLANPQSLCHVHELTAGPYGTGPARNFSFATATPTPRTVYLHRLERAW